MLQTFQVRVPGADFEVEIVLGVVVGGWSVCLRWVGILLRGCSRRPAEEREAEQQETSLNIFQRVHLCHFDTSRLGMLKRSRYPVLASKLKAARSRFADPAATRAKATSSAMLLRRKSWRTA